MIHYSAICKTIPVHYQSAVNMISFAQVWTAQWTDTIPSRNVRFTIRIHLTLFCFNTHVHSNHFWPKLYILIWSFPQPCSRRHMEYSQVQRTTFSHAASHHGQWWCTGWAGCISPINEFPIYVMTNVFANSVVFWSGIHQLVYHSMYGKLLYWWWSSVLGARETIVVIAILLISIFTVNPSVDCQLTRESLILLRFPILKARERLCMSLLCLLTWPLQCPFDSVPLLT